MEKILTATYKTQSYLIIKIDNHWTSSDFALLFDNIHRLYCYNDFLSQMLEKNQFHKSSFIGTHDIQKLRNLPHIDESYYNFLSVAKLIFEMPVDYINTLLSKQLFFFGYYQELQVNKINYASPGSIDFLGIAKIFEMIKDTITHYSKDGKKNRELDLDIKKSQKEELELNNLQKKIKILTDLGFTEQDIMYLIGMEASHTKNIVDFIKAKKITKIEMRKEKK